MPSVRVVPAFDPGNDRHPGFGVRAEPSAGEQLAFEGGEEALGHGIVVAVADRAHRGADADFLAAAPEADRSLLAALIGVMDHRGWPARPNGHIERVEHEIGPQMGRHRPAHNPAAADVEDDREIEEPHPDGDVGDIGDPKLIGALRPEGPFDQIGRRGGRGIATRRPWSFRRVTPTMPCSRIRRATRWWLMRSPPSVSSAWIIGAP